MNDNEFQQNVLKTKTIIFIGAVATLIVLLGVILDLIIGIATGGNLSALPQSAVGRFNQLHTNCFLGLYNLDFLNIINQLILIPAYFSLFLILKKENYSASLFALIIFFIGTVIFVSNNTALTMLDLSNKYFSAPTESQRLLFSAAGEAMLAKGSHGSFSSFIGFLIPNLAGIIISWVMIKSSVFSKLTGYLGFTGSLLISLYLILVTMIPSVQSMATAFAAIPGLLLLSWMILFMVALFKLSARNS